MTPLNGWFLFASLNLTGLNGPTKEQNEFSLSESEQAVRKEGIGDSRGGNDATGSADAGDPVHELRFGSG